MTEIDALLVVRSDDDLPSAVKSARELLDYRRRRLPSHRDVLLGVCSPDILERLLRPEREPRERTVEVYETISVGPWTLALLKGIPLANEPSAKGRRARVLEALVAPADRAPSSGRRGSFHTVFTASEPEHEVGETLAELRRRFAGLVGDLWFVDHPSRGLCGPLVDRGLRAR
jgi:hypothetical protein